MLEETLHNFDPISLEEMDEVSLMNRSDTKFLIPIKLIEPLLLAMQEFYRSLSVSGTRLSGYESHYFDTLDNRFYLDHHNGRPNRFKIRIRQYVESNIQFLEVKEKYKGKTWKSRIAKPEFEASLTQEDLSFIEEKSRKARQLVFALTNSFQRVTLVDKGLSERVTLDFNLSFQKEDQRISFPKFVIAEVKQDGVNRNSPFMQFAKSRLIRPYSVSKYCLGLAHLNPGIKRNLFKEKFNYINTL